MLIHDEIKKLKNQDTYTRADIVNLIFYCDLLMIRNNTIGTELKKAIEQIVALQKRINFYRSVTQPRDVD